MKPVSPSGAHARSAQTKRDSHEHDGRNDCELCTRYTGSDTVVILYDRKREPGDRVHRAHLKCLESNNCVAGNLATLKGNW